MLSQIVGFEIAVERLEAKFKLSQNRPRANQARIIRSLQTNDDSSTLGIAKLMKTRIGDMTPIISAWHCCLFWITMRNWN
jgi:transcriptional regulator